MIKVAGGEISTLPLSDEQREFTREWEFIDGNYTDFLNEVKRGRLKPWNEFQLIVQRVIEYVDAEEMSPHEQRCPTDFLNYCSPAVFKKLDEMVRIQGMSLTIMDICKLGGQMFSQCFCQLAVDGVIAESDNLRSWESKYKGWIRNVVFGEECEKEQIKNIADEIRGRLINYAQDNFRRLLEESRKIVFENLLGDLYVIPPEAEREILSHFRDDAVKIVQKK